MVTIAVTPEEAGEPRVAVSPETVKKLTALGATVRVAAVPARARAFPMRHIRRPARPSPPARRGAAGADILLKVRRPSAEEVKALKPGAIVAAMLSPFDDRPGLDALAGTGAA